MFSPDLGEADTLQGPCPGVSSFHLYPCSHDNENFVYLADFPKELSIKYLVNSFHGDTAIVTETEEVDCPALLPTSSLSIPNQRGFTSPPVRVKGPRGRNALRDPEVGQQKLHL